MAGVQVICISAEALVERDRRGRTVATARPDQMLYLRKRIRRPLDGPNVGDYGLPDVVLDVDVATEAISPETVAVLHRVGRALGQRIGGNTSAEPYKLHAEVRHPKGGRHGD